MTSFQSVIYILKERQKKSSVYFLTPTYFTTYYLIKSKTMKNLLLLVFVLSSFGLFGQQLQSVHRNDLEPKETSPNAANNTYQEPPRITVGSPRGSVIQLGSSSNIYSILREGQTQVDYNNDLNAVSFVHRQNVGAAGGSGIISFDISTDNGLTWNSTNKPITPSVGTGVLTGNRYPNGLIWNPAGNTSTANARFVALGGSLTSVTGTWGMFYQSSSKLDGSDVKEHYYATPDTNSLIPGGLTVLPNGDIYALDVWNNAFQAMLIKMSYNSNTSDFDFTPSYWSYDLTGLSATDSTNFFQSDPNIAFGPDGMTGYAVLAATTPEHGFFTVRPNIWKTTNGGTTWTKLPSIDWEAFPELLQWTLPVENTSVATNGRFPYLRNFDVTVDMNNDLHIFANMGSRSDSLDPGFIWINTVSTNSLWRIQTNDGSSYAMELVEPWENTWADLQGDGQRWWGPRPQAARSEDGSKLFFGFTMTDTLFTQNTVNEAPDFWVYAKNLTNGFDTLKNLSVGTFAEFVCSWATMSPIVIEDKNGIDYEIPMVYGVPTGTDLAPIDYYYLQGTGFTELELSPVSTNELEVQAANIKVYPNPTEGLLNIDLNALTEEVNIEIFNIVGQQVQSIQNARNLATLDVSNIANGVYFVRISNDEAVIAKKIIVSHH
jgi:hypothetical protein